MRDEADLVAEILRAPDDEGPRRVLGDILLARNDPRGELISVQCELARRFDPVLVAREAELIAAHGKRWLIKLPGAKEPLLRRGFIERVTCSVADWISNAASIVGRTPLRAVRITDVTRVDDVERLLAVSAMRQIRDLQLETGSGLGKKHCQVLAASPVLAQLTRLALPRCTILDRGAVALAASPHLGGLVELSLHACAIGPAGIAALARAPLPALRVLDASANRFFARGAHEVVTRGFPALADLDLTTCGLGPQGGEIVAAAPRPALERLILAGNALDDAAARRLAGAKQLVALRELDLHDNPITRAGATAFLSAKLPALRRLVLDDMPGTLAARFPS